MITQIADILASAGLRFTAREIEDIVWLASRIDEPSAGDLPTVSPEATSDDEDIDNREEERIQNGSADELNPRTSEPTELSQAKSVMPLYAEGMQGSLAGSTLRVRGLSQSPTPDVLRRALQPFMRRVPSSWQFRLDEEATVTHTADTGMWMPVFTAIRERRFDLTLVIEDCTSAELRDATLRDLSKHFRNYSGLRQVRCYRLRGDTTLSLVTMDGKSEHGVERLEQHRTGDGRHLVLFATDSTSARWRNGSAQEFLYIVGAYASVSVLHLLPHAAWRRTVIGEPDVMLHCERPGVPNTRFKAILPWWMDADEIHEALPVPVLGLDATSVGIWARAISALGGATMPGVLMNRPAITVSPIVPPLTVPHDPVKLVARYRNMASDSAYRLAVYLSKTNPVTIPIMRLVQRTMLPNSGEGELAEFLLGGLVARGQSRDGQTESLYNFRDGVADELLKALRFSEEEKIARQLALVGEALESIGDGPHNLEVAFPVPAGEPRLSEWAMPFATVSRQILRAQTQLEATPTNLDSTIDELAVASERTSFRILHLSDLHFGRPSEGGNLPAALGPVWQEHLAHLAKNSEVDLVCISGDLTWTGSADEFSELDQFLDNTLSALGLPKNRLFVVPGNHDMRWEGGLTRTNASQLFAAGAGTRTMLTGAEAAAVARAQSNYREWLKRSLPHQSAVTRDNYADFQLSILGWAVPVRIIGIDSAWMTSIGGGAALSAEQLQPLNVISLDGLNVALIHHQPKQLQWPPDLRERLARARVNLLLHGHGYEEAATNTVDGDDPMVSSGVGLSAQRDRSMAFHVIDFVLNAKNGPAQPEITVHEWDKRALSWAATTADASREAEEAQQPSGPPVSAAEPQEIFVGRNAELKRLLEILTPAKASAGHSERCMIVGSAGIGKTALFHQFLTRYLPGNGDQEDRYVLLAARRGEAFEDQLLKKFSYSSTEGLIDHLNDQQTLVVIDDIDSSDQMNAANRFAERLPACPVLLIGRYLDTGAESTGWDVLTLAQLPEWESVQLLSLLLRSNDSEIAKADAVAIVAALHGLPALVRLVGEHLTGPTASTRLLAWLGVAYSGELSPVLALELARDFPWLRRALSPIFENRWHAELDVEDLDVLSALAHGPISGFSTSLGLALSGYARRTASAATTRKFTRICDSAVASGLLRRGGPEWRFAAPAYVGWLRERGSKRGNPAMRRWSDWLAIRMAAPAKSRARPWREITELPAGMIEWLATCPPDAARLVRPVCVPYAVTYGPIDAWQQFCWRMLQTRSNDDTDFEDWYFTLAELSYARQDLGAALEAVDQYLRLKERTARVDNRLEASINAGIRLRNRILADQGRRPEVPLQQRSVPPFFMPDEELPLEPRPHQRYLADAALAATLHAGRETTYIGLVVQTIGSGISNTLATYLKARLDDRSLKRPKIIVVADRVNVVRELSYILGRMRGIDITEPQTVENLRAAVRSEHPPVIVTTEHKLRQLPSKYDGDCLVVGVSLRRPSRSLVAHLPRAQMIVFGDESLVLTPSPARSLGPVIASYSLQEAIRDGYVVTPLIRSLYVEGMFTYESRAGRRSAQLSLAGITMVVEHLQKHWYSHDTSSPDKRVLIVESEPDAWLLAESLSANRGPIDSQIMVLAGSVSHKQETLADFRRSASSALLVTTTGMAPGLPLAGIDVCYVAAQLTLTTQLKIVSFVNRPITGRKYGEIIDFVDHDWKILGLPN